MAKKNKKTLITRYPMRSLGIFIFVMGLVYGFRNTNIVQQVGINEISSQLTNGETTVSGTILKDSSVGTVGRYYLSLDVGQYILLDSRDIDALVGSSVSIYGILALPTQTDNTPFMIVKELRTN